MNPTPYLVTERLALRELTEDDAENLLALDSDPEVMRFLGPMETDLAVHQNWLRERAIPYYADHPGFGFFAAIEKATGDFCGWFILRPALHYRFAAEAGFTERDVEIGYRLRHEKWGRGYATEGAKALMHHAFTELDVPCAVAIALKTNVASWRVMEKIGLTRTSECSLPGYDAPAVIYRLCQ